MVLRFFLFAAMLLFMSCAEAKFDNPDDPASDSYIGQSSSSARASSSSVKYSSSSVVVVLNSSSATSSSSYTIVLPSSSSAKQSSSSAVKPSSSSSLETYTVTYNANNGKGGPTTQTKIYDVALTLSATVPTRTDYTFASWNTDPDGYGTSYAPRDKYTDNDDVTLYAQWIRNSKIIKGPSVNYGGETYETVVIGSQTWFKRNLNYDVEGSKCYDNSTANCGKYGRLYDWETAMNLPGCSWENSCALQIGAKHMGICPSGWHIPSDAEWTTLMDFVGGASTAGTKLKSTSGWYNDGNGTDEYGFSALPGGKGGFDGYFYDFGDHGFWWSVTEYDAGKAYFRWMSYDEDVKKDYNYKDSGLFSIRCLQD